MGKMKEAAPAPKRDRSKKSAKKDTAPAPPTKGDNIDKFEVDAELLKLQKRQLAHDKKRKKIIADLNEENGQITADIKSLGFKRKSFNRAYEENKPSLMAATDEDRQAAEDLRIINANEYHTIFKALNSGKTLNFLDIERMAPAAQKRLEEYEQRGESEEKEL